MMAIFHGTRGVPLQMMKNTVYVFHKNLEKLYFIIAVLNQHLKV